MAVFFRWVAMAALLILIPLTLLGIAYRMRTTAMQQYNTISYAVTQAANMMDSTLMEAGFVLDQIVQDSTVISAMEAGSPSRNHQIDEYRTINTVLQHSESSHAVYDIRLYFVHDKYYTSEQISFFPMSMFEAESIYQDASPRVQITEAHLQKYKDKPDTVVLTCYRTVTDTKGSFPVIGAACIDIEISLLQTQSDLQRIAGIRGQALERQDGSYIFLSDQYTEDRPNTRMITKELLSFPWTFTVLMDRSLPASMEDVVFWGLLIGIALFLLFIVLITIRAFSNRVTALISVLEEKLTGKDVQLHQTHLRSLNRLNTAVRQTADLVAWQKEQLTAQQEAQMKLIQAQVNPHFLYNALDCVNWLIGEGAYSRASELVISIGRYYRLILSKGKDILTVQDDLNLALSYIAIQEERMHKPIDVQVRMQEGAQDCLIPKMTIQPIVENSVIHGFHRLEGPAHLDIDVSLEKEWVYILITDNGCGMPIRENPADYENHAGGFGLYSVDQRCKYFSGRKDCGISIESVSGEMTAVTIKFAQKYEKIDQNHNI